MFQDDYIKKSNNNWSHNRIKIENDSTISTEYAWQNFAKEEHKLITIITISKEHKKNIKYKMR